MSPRYSKGDIVQWQLPINDHWLSWPPEMSGNCEPGALRRITARIEAIKRINPSAVHKLTRSHPCYCQHISSKWTACPKPFTEAMSWKKPSASLPAQSRSKIPLKEIVHSLHDIHSLQKELIRSVVLLSIGYVGSIEVTSFSGPVMMRVVSFICVRGHRSYQKTHQL